MRRSLRALIAFFLLFFYGSTSAVTAAQTTPSWPLSITSVAGLPFGNLNDDLNDSSNGSTIKVTGEGIVFNSAAEAHAYLDNFYNVYNTQVRNEHPTPFQTLEAVLGPSKLEKPIDAEFTGYSSEEMTNLLERALALEIMHRRNFRQNAQNPPAFEGKLLEILFAHRFYFTGKRNVTPLAVISPIGAVTGGPIVPPVFETTPVAVAEPNRFEQPIEEPTPAAQSADSGTATFIIYGPSAGTRPQITLENIAPSRPAPVPSVHETPQRPQKSPLEIISERLLKKVSDSADNARMHNDPASVEACQRFTGVTTRVVSDCGQDAPTSQSLKELLLNLEKQLATTSDGHCQVTIEQAIDREVSLYRTCTHSAEERASLERLAYPTAPIATPASRQVKEVAEQPIVTPPPSTPAVPTPEPAASPPTYVDLPAPEELDVTPGDGSVKLKWKPVRGATAYIVTLDGKFHAPVTGTQFTIKGLTNDQNYAISVGARNNYGVSDQLASTDAKPRLPAPLSSADKTVVIVMVCLGIIVVGFVICILVVIVRSWHSTQQEINKQRR